MGYRHVNHEQAFEQALTSDSPHSSITSILKADPTYETVRDLVEAYVSSARSNPFIAPHLAQVLDDLTLSSDPDLQQIQAEELGDDLGRSIGYMLGDEHHFRICYNGPQTWDAPVVALGPESQAQLYGLRIHVGPYCGWIGRC